MSRVEQSYFTLGYQQKNLMLLLWTEKTKEIQENSAVSWDTAQEINIYREKTNIYSFYILLAFSK